MKLEFSRQISYNSNQISWKYVECEPICSMRTDGHDETNSHFWQFCERAEVFRCFFLSCKANARVKLAKTWARPALFQIHCYCVVLSLFVLFCCYCVVLLLFVLFCYYLCWSIYRLCVNVYCTTATGCLPNYSWQIYQKHFIISGYFELDRQVSNYSD